MVNGSELKRALKHDHTAHIYLITVQGLDKTIKSGLSSNKRMVILMDVKDV